jgi:hypothetical protein
MRSDQDNVSWSSASGERRDESDTEPSGNASELTGPVRGDDINAWLEARREGGSHEVLLAGSRPDNERILRQLGQMNETTMCESVMTRDSEEKLLIEQVVQVDSSGIKGPVHGRAYHNNVSVFRE